ncbi:MULTISPECIES: hypothetical protein [Saliphagus]|uniref:Uncharacterized protein n=1 Tax=Saliphagus infecundisoli TaxID=1849069 RepID=A0ABD5QDK8_9EURY|nr:MULTISPECIES: hypothetical protein [Saliphagus]
MSLKRMLSGDPSRSSLLYIVIGGLSLVKAVALYNDRERFRRELTDAALFLGVGLVLRRYGQLKEQKRQELESQVPGWLAKRGGSDGSERSGPGLRARAKARFGDEPEPEPTYRERARQAVSDRR